MDINLQKLPSSSWDASMVMEDQASFDTLWPNYAFDQNHHIHHHMVPSSSSCQQISAINPISDDQPRKLQNQAAADQQEQDKEEEEQEEELGPMKEMMFRIAAMQPVDIDPASIRKPKRRNVRISDDPQSVAARLRREKISEKIRILQRLVPGGNKMDTASMLDEAIRYVKFLKRQIRQLQVHHNPPSSSIGLLPSVSTWPSAVPTTTTTTSAAITLNKGSYSTTTAAIPPSAFECNMTSEPMCFNHEVIGDN